MLGVESGLKTFKEVIISGMGFELSMSLDRNGSLEIGLNLLGCSGRVQVFFSFSFLLFSNVGNGGTQ